MSLKTWIGWPGLLSGGLGIVVAAGLWLSLDRAIEQEAGKVSFLKNEIAKLDKEVAEVGILRDVITALLARKQVVEVLQKDRFVTVQLLDQLARQRPNGVYLSALREDGPLVLVTGFAATEREVAAFLANLNGSPLLERAQLLELRSESAPRLPAYPARFTVSMAVKGRQALPRAGPPRIPSDVHPGDPK